MHDPRQPDICFQGRTRPREGETDADRHKGLRLGDLCLAVGNLTDAMAYYQEALARTSEDDQDTRLEIVLKTSGCLRRQGKSEDALRFVESIISGFSGARRRDLLAEKAMLFCLVGRYGEAAGVCEEVQREDSLGEREKDAGIYLVLGHVLSRLCKWKQAIVCLEQAATFARMCGDMTALGNALNNLGIVYKNLCRLGDAARCLRQAVRVARQTGDDASLAVRLLNLATTLYKQGSLDASAKAIDECLKISALLSLKRTANLASICKARLEKTRGNLDEAVRLLEGVAAEAARIDEPRVRLLAEETLGDVLCEMDQLSRAREVLEECLGSLPAEAKDIEAEVRSRLGEVYFRLGMVGQARQCLTQALKIAEGTGDLYEVGRSLRLLAGASAGGADRKCLARARHIFAAIGAKLEQGITLCELARLGHTAPERAARAFEEAITIFDRCGACDLKTEALCSLALVRLEMGEHEKALSALRQTEGAPGRSSRRVKLVRETHSKIDAHLSRQLAGSVHEVVGSLDEAFLVLKARLKADGLALVREDQAGPQAIKVCGFDCETATQLAAVALASERVPFVSTSVGELLPHGSYRSRFGSMLAIGLAAGGEKGCFVACWEGRQAARTSGPERGGFLGAYHEIQRLVPLFERVIVDRRPATAPLAFGGMLTADSRLQQVLLSLPRIAATKASVLVIGETGTGKELVARALHAVSPRRARPFIVQNCAALPENLLESELFGHRAGAFTDARTDKRGLLEVAAGGTFFLDEIGDVSAAIQAKMLRAIESGEIRRLGDTSDRSIDVRFVSATNKDLEREVEEGRFRRDLYYRLNVVALWLPPLRARRDDIILLARLFLSRFARLARRSRIDIDDGAVGALLAYSWPGNVRQLENEIERAVAMLGQRQVLTSELLSPSILGGTRSGKAPTLRDEVRNVERSRILAVLARSNWNKTQAARALGDVSRPALVAKMKRLGIPLAKPSRESVV